MEWVSVEDRLPEIGKWYLCFSANHCQILFLDSINPLFWLKHGDWDWKVTHWMPLPEPPKESTGL